MFVRKCMHMSHSARSRSTFHTALYIDGFNLYYGAAKDTPYKWLNPIALAETVFRRNQIKFTRYCSARVKPLPHDPKAPQRQGVYWRALRTLPDIEIIEGLFKIREKYMRTVSPPPQ
jgi:hypothetical protein